MKYSLKQLGLISASFVSLATLAVVPASALQTAGGGSPSTAAADQAKLKLIISRGDTEISRRLTTLNSLSSKISADTKLSASDKASLASEVSTEISGLTTLKTTLDAETTVSAAKTDAQSIFDDYRVYALIVPKVLLVKTADGQQVIESKLTALAAKLQADITADKTAGKDVTALQTKLDDLNTQVAAAQAISTSIETKVIGLQPSDYNSDHTLLSGDRDQLKTAQADLATATSDAKTIVSGLKTL